MAERLIQGQVVNAQNVESIDTLKGENKKLFDKLTENDIKLKKYEINNDTDSIKLNEIQLLNDKIHFLVDVCLVFLLDNKKTFI